MTSILNKIIPGAALCLLLGSASCKSKYKNILDAEASDVTCGQCCESDIRKCRLDAVAAQIAAHATCDGPAVSIDGRQTAQYRNYLWLSRHATDDELIALTKHKSGNVKAYAFQALCQRNAPSCTRILEDHINDETEFMEYAGCVLSPKTINVYYFGLLEGRLSPGERKNYEEAITRFMNTRHENWVMPKSGLF